MTVPCPLMGKQWSTAYRKDPSPDLWGTNRCRESVYVESSVLEGLGRRDAKGEGHWKGTGEEGLNTGRGLGGGTQKERDTGRGLGRRDSKGEGHWKGNEEVATL